MPSLPEGYRAVVVGAGGGLGMAFTDLLRQDPRCALVVGVGGRSGTPQPSLDLQDEGSIARVAEQLRPQGPWHLIVVATGVLHGPGLQPEKRLADLQAQTLRTVLDINTVGPALLLRHLGPQLDRSRSLMGLLSAKVGSIGDNRLGGWYAYRASKAALNMLVRTAAIELRRTHPGAVLAALHPGTVKSDLSRPFRGDEIGREAAQAGLDLLQRLDALQPEDSGCFLSYDGQRLPW